MNFALTEEQQMVKDTAARFADEVLKPQAAHFDETHEHPAEAVEALGELGFMGIAVADEYGGAGMDYVSYVLAMTEISRGDASVGVIMSANNSLYCYPVMTFGSDEQKRAVPHPGGQRRKNRLLRAHRGRRGLRSRRHAHHRGFGRRRMDHQRREEIHHQRPHRLLRGYRRGHRQERRRQGHQHLYRGPEEHPRLLGGLHRGKKMGICASGTSELVFEDARIPKGNLLGQPGGGLKQMLTTLDSGRIGIGSQALGIGRAVLEEAVAYALEREQFGKPLSAMQAIQWKLADIATQLDAAELLLLRAAWLEDQHANFEKEAAMAKMFASDAAMNAAIEGVQILGGYGYCKEYPMERHMRDAKITQIYEGTNEIMRLVIARNTLRMR